MRVRAKQTGFWGGARRRQGVVFTLPEGEAPASWMEALVDERPARKPRVKAEEQGEQTVDDLV